jgi:hypothetical protein
MEISPEVEEVLVSFVEAANSCIPKDSHRSI